MSVLDSMNERESAPSNLFKIGNSDPTQEFAVNTKVALRNLLGASQERVQEVSGFDDFERPVNCVDATGKQRMVTLEFLSCCASIDAEDEEVSLGSILQQVAATIKDALENPEPNGLERSRPHSFISKCF